MKWIGFLLAATACAGIGQWASSQIHRRVRLLESSMSLVEFLKARLSFTLAEPAVILQEWTQTSSIKDLPFPSACLCLYEQGMVFPSAWEESLQTENLNALTMEDRNCLRLLFDWICSFWAIKKDFAIMTVYHWKRTSVSCRTIYRIMCSGSESGSYKKRVRAVWP